MSISRRGFLGAAGLSALAVAGTSAGRAVERATKDEPGAAPRTRWAMAIDLRKCLEKEGCDKCMVACHRAHNVPAPGDAAHEVKWIWKQPFEDVFPSQGAYAADALRGKAIPVLCNHCDNPPCVRVCPTQATWKRGDGIVMMDFHRCIGCRYCVAACPYGSRSFNWSDPRLQLGTLNADYPTRTKGVVEKCTLCEERLAAGRPPACVEVCPPKAMLFGNLDDPGSEIRTVLRGRFSIQRKPELGTHPEIFYIV
jgi:molybdopterin-containing oxidoreductase family iron-sulfur binding subunit